MNKQGELAKSDANHHPTVEMPSAIGASSAFDDVGIASWDPSKGWIDQCPGHIWGTCGISNFAILQQANLAMENWKSNAKTSEFHL